MRNFAAVVFTLLISIVANSSPSRCLGGDGPKPFSDISGNINFKIRAVNVPGTMQEYFIWEKKNTLVYRESSGDVKALALNPQPGKPKEVGLSKLAQPISRVIDSDERYLVSKGNRIWLFDTWNPNWSPLLEGEGATPLFWHNSGVVSYIRRKTQDKDIYDFYFSRPGQFSKTPVCSYGQELPVEMKMAQGTSAPNVYFYNVLDRKRGNRRSRDLAVYPLNVLNCKFEKGTIYEGIRHPVLDVSYLAERGAIAVKLENDKQNLLWWSPKGCNYYDVGNQGAIIPNFKQPVLISWHHNNGLEILYPETSEKVKILEGLPLLNINKDDLWITDDLKQLYVGTRLIDEPNRYLLQMDLDPRF